MQVHGIAGTYVSRKNLKEQFGRIARRADFLYTDQQGIGIGILTADCLPIVFSDCDNRMVCVVHAGLRGTMQKIAVKALACLQKRFGVNLSNLRIFFGPSAKDCCYEVGKEVCTQLSREGQRYALALHKRDNSYFLSLPLLNTLQLLQEGIKESQINTIANECTICNVAFCSYRRSKTSLRQATIALLR